MKKKFKDGENVRLKKNLVVGCVYGGMTLSLRMVFEGYKKLEYNENCAPGNCMIENQNVYWYYSEEMLTK